MPALEIRSYVLKPGVRERFHELFESKVMAQLTDAGIRVVRYGPSLHDEQSYVLMRAFDSLEQHEEQEERFYGSMLWREGYREEVLAMIETHQDVVLNLDEAVISGLAN